MSALQSLKGFDVDGATLTLWLFKRSAAPAGAAPKYSGHWVDTNDDLDVALKAAISSARSNIAETIDYSLLSQNNEASALLIKTDETHAGLIVDATAQETPSRKIKESQEIHNTTPSMWRNSPRARRSSMR